MTIDLYLLLMSF